MQVRRIQVEQGRFSILLTNDFDGGLVEYHDAPQSG
jgi:hypothetical protein